MVELFKLDSEYGKKKMLWVWRREESHKLLVKFGNFPAVGVQGRFEGCIAFSRGKKVLTIPKVVICADEARQHKAQEINVSTFDRRWELIIGQSSGSGICSRKGNLQSNWDGIPLDAGDKEN